MTEADWAWAAGLYEGEGSVTTNRVEKPTSVPCLKMCLSTTDLDVLERFHLIVGVGRVYGPRLVPDRKPMWRWEMSREGDVIATLRMFWPYLGRRRQEQAWEAIGRRGIPTENSRRGVPGVGRPRKQPAATRAAVCAG